MDYFEIYEQWLNSDDLDLRDRAILNAMDEQTIRDSFRGDLDFGTAGMRGIIGMGTYRMNEFTVMRATKGLAEYLTALGGESMKSGVVIAYDTRLYSSRFAIAAAKVLAGAGINAYLFEDVRPVPVCSFAIRESGAAAGIMITASHNPKEYNGYKVYGADGAQMSPEATDKVVEFIRQTPYFGIYRADCELSPETIKGLDGKKFGDHITIIGKSVDEKYYERVLKLGLSPEAVAHYGSDIKLVYTPIHGSGYRPVCEVLGRMGINVSVVPEQAVFDPDFPTVRVPNPEESDTLSMGVELADRIGSDVVIGTDPDSDRMGVAVRDNLGKFVLLNGNQIGVLLTDYILRRRSESGVLPENGAIVKTIVTTDLAKKVAESYGVVTFDVLTGFKYIGEKIKEWETSGEYTYLFGFEESYGSLCGTHARDKDAVVASMLFAEMLCCYRSKESSLYSVLQNIYAKFGYYCEKAASVAYPGLDGMETMAEIMKSLRHAEYDSVTDARVVEVVDFAAGIRKFPDGTALPTDLPQTNALKLHLEGGDWICVRPSGTEPKLKIYVSCSAADRISAERKADIYLAYMKKAAAPAV